MPSRFSVIIAVLFVLTLVLAARPGFAELDALTVGAIHPSPNSPIDE